MQFIAPLALALGALAGPIILLYMLRLRRREVPISSTLLWQRVMRDKEANAPWQRLRRNILLLLQLLILAAFVLALARPYVEVPTVTTGRIALLIDASASMNSTDVQPTRFEAARQQALTIVDSLNASDSVAVVRVAEGPEVVENYTNDGSRLRTAINAMQPGKASADWNAALTLAAAGGAGAEKFTIIIISDGGLTPGLVGNYGEVRFIPIGSSDRNLAITALATANDPVAGPQIYGRISNYGAVPADVVFSVELDGKLFNAATYTVPANGYSDVVVSGLPATAQDGYQRVKASLTRPAASTIPDYLALDDAAWTVYNPANAGRALLMTRGNRFLETGFGSMRDWQAFRADPSQPFPTAIPDLYVFDRWLPLNLPDANMLIIDPPNSTPLFTVGLASQKTKVLSVKPDDARTRYLKFNDVNVREFKTISNAPWAETLVQAEGGPLLLAGQVNGRRVAILPFNLFDSDLALKIAWPILLSNLTEWYRAPRALGSNTSLQPGQTIAIQPAAESTTVRVQRPDGATTTYQVDRPLLIYADTPLTGIYTVEVYKGEDVVQRELFTVNLFDGNESNINVRTPSIGTARLAAAPKEEIGQREFWPWIALAALAVLVFEWYAYHQRLETPGLGAGRSRRFARR